MWRRNRAQEDRNLGSVEDLAAPSQKKSGAFVCITGQIHRLELDGKIRNLFEPMEATHRVDLAFVLSMGQATFVAKRSQKVFEGIARGAFPTFDHVRKRLVGRFGLLHMRKMMQPEMPIVNQQYVDALDKGGQDHSLRVHRSKSHIRQWSSYFHCLDMLDQFEDFLGARYDVVMRMREDVHIPFPVDFSSVLQHVDKRTLLVQKCDSWGGINDKIAVLARESAVEYFTSPLEQFYLRPNETMKAKSSQQVKNPETFLKRSYEEEDFAVNFLEANVLLAIPVRRTVDGVTCYPLGYRSLRCLHKQLGAYALHHIRQKACSY